jgi:prepilin-type N-terminal cleavage/methylation domain-containing protein/prepilin-type processing-associated H-X9-DG protein
MKRSAQTKGFTLVELLVVIGIIALLISILLPSLNRARETANRVKCAANLRSIGQAILLYSNENRGLYPRTYYSSGVAGAGFITATSAGGGGNNQGTDPFATDSSTGNTVGNNNVCSAFFMLLRNEDITANVFVCPSSNAISDPYGNTTSTGTNTAQNVANFDSPLNNYLSYSYAVPYADVTAVGAGFKLNSSIDPTYAVASDINPGVSPTSTDNIYIVTTSSAASSMTYGNSNNHNKSGQNVLFADGHVEFDANPFVGMNRDNIFTRNNTNNGVNGGSADVNDGPFGPTDSVLLPTDDNT